MKKFLLLPLFFGALILGGCSDADVASSNLSAAATNFSLF